MFHIRRLQLFLLAFEAFFALPTHPVFHVPRIVCRRFGFRALHQCKRTALHQSDTGFRFGRCGVASSLFPQSRTARTKVAILRAILLQPCQASCSWQLFSLSHTAKRSPCSIDDSRGDIQHDIFTELDTFLTTSRFTVFVIWIAVCFSKLW